MDDNHVTPLERMLRRVHGSTVTVRVDAMANGRSGYDATAIIEAIREYERTNGTSWRD